MRSKDRLYAAVLTHRELKMYLGIGILAQFGMLGCVIANEILRAHEKIFFLCVAISGICVMILVNHFTKMISRFPDLVQLTKLAKQDIETIKEHIDFANEWRLVEYSFKELTIKRKLMVCIIYSFCVIAITVGILSFFELIPPLALKNVKNGVIEYVPRWVEFLMCFGGAIIGYISAECVIFVGFENIWDNALKQLLSEEERKTMNQ